MGGLVTALISVLFTFLAQGAAGSAGVGLAACCLPGIVGAIVGVWHYTSNHDLTLELGSGAKLGALTGVVGGFVGGLIGFLLRMVGALPSAAEQLELARQAMIDRGMTDAQIEQGLKIQEMFTGPLGQVLGFVVGMLIFALIGALGGMIGAAIFKKGPRNAGEVV